MSTPNQEEWIGERSSKKSFLTWDLFLPSVEEIYLMLEPEDYRENRETHSASDLVEWFTASHYRELAQRCLNLGAKAVTLKSGPRGVYMRTGKNALQDLEGIQESQKVSWSDREAWAPAFEVEVFGSATGAGDSSIAGILSGLLRGGHYRGTPSVLASYAVSRTCTSSTRVSGIRDWEEAHNILENNLPQIDPRIEEEGWRYDSGERLWYGPADRSRGLGASIP